MAVASLSSTVFRYECLFYQHLSIGVSYFHFSTIFQLLFSATFQTFFGEIKKVIFTKLLQHTMDLVQKTLLTALVGLLVLMVIFYLQTHQLFGPKTHKSNTPTFLIIGANNSGKTSLYYKLKAIAEEDEDKDKLVPTISSLESNESLIKLPFADKAIGKNFKLIDYPGHLKYDKLLKQKILQDIGLKNLKGVIVVIDSSSISVNQDGKVKLICEKIYNILSQTEKLPNGVDVLFAVNKIDLFDSLPTHRLKLLLEQGMNEYINNELAKTGIDNEDEDEEEEGNLQDFETTRQLWSIIMKNKQFKFEILEGNMEFISGSVVKNKTEGWENWFDEKVVNYGGM